MIKEERGPGKGEDIDIDVGGLARTALVALLSQRE